VGDRDPRALPQQPARRAEPAAEVAQPQDDDLLPVQIARHAHSSSALPAALARRAASSAAAQSSPAGTDGSSVKRKRRSSTTPHGQSRLAMKSMGQYWYHGV